MKKSTVIHTVIAGSLAAAICLPLQAATATPAEQAITAAETAIADANAHDWIWRDTEKFLDDAKAAAEKGEMDTAIKLADKARSQAELAVKQYETEKNMDRSHM